MTKKTDSILINQIDRISPNTTTYLIRVSGTSLNTAWWRAIRAIFVTTEALNTFNWTHKQRIFFKKIQV